MRSFGSNIQTVLGMSAILLLATGIATADSWFALSPEGTLTVAEARSASPPALTVSGYDETGIDVTVDAIGFALLPRTTKGGEFVKVDWPDAPIAGEIGAPGIPVIRRLFVAPPDTSVTLTVREGEGTAITADAVGSPLRLLPVQLPIPKRPGARENAKFMFDDAAYAADTEQFGARAVVEELGIARGQRLFLLEVRPIDYNPVARTLTFWAEIEIDIDFLGEAGPPSGLTPLPGIQRILLNPDPNAPRQRGSGNYLIITGTNFESDIASFAAAKEAQGFTVTTHAVTPGTANTTIKSYIQGLWGDPPPPTAPDYVLLVGDTGTIPHWDGQGAGSPDTDLPYVCMDGSTDWYPDIALGRFPVDNSGDLQAIVDKTLYYENGPLADPEYKKRAVFMAGNDNYQITEGTHNYVISNYMDPNGFQSDKLYEVTYGATTQDVINSFNDGRFYGIYSGHGSSTSWADGPALSAGQVQALTNENLYPMVCSFACDTGDFAYYDECFMETWVLTPDNGAVTSWGSSVIFFWTVYEIL